MLGVGLGLGELNIHITTNTKYLSRKNNAEPFAIVWPKFEGWLKSIQEEEG